MSLRYRICFSLIMAFFLSSLMTALVCFLNIGFGALYLSAWRQAFTIAWPSAALIAFLFGPFVHALCLRIERSFKN